MSDPFASGPVASSMSDDARAQQGAGGLPGELKAAIRRQRIADAERSGAIYDLRGAELARLEVLDEALAPIYGGLPPEIDLFDHGIVPSGRPRLYVDIVAFIEMGRDSRFYRFLLDTHEGRIALGESADVGVIKQLVTDHIARRLLAREKALASTAYPTGMLASAQYAGPSKEAVPVDAMAAALALEAPRLVRAGLGRRFFWPSLFFFGLGLVTGAGMLLAWTRSHGFY